MSGLRIDAGANRPTPNRLNTSTPKSASGASRAEASAAPPFSATAFGRMRQAMDQAAGPVTHSQPSALQGELERLKIELAHGGSAPAETQAAHLSVANENLAASRSRLSDVDAARSAAHLAQEQIRTQAGAALQAQANTVARTTRDLLDS